MRAVLEQRLAELKSEFDSGQRVLSELQKKEQELQATLMRISGAIQVLEELLRQEGESGPSAEQSAG